MPDRYIDYDEVPEYGRPLATELVKLKGASTIVNTEILAQRILASVEAVETELQKARSDRSDLRGERTGTEDAETDAREIINRFFHHLHSLPRSASFDFEAFYPGKNLGDISRMKPADLRAKAKEVLDGFEAPKNKPVTAFADWKKDIGDAHDALDAALTGKGSAKTKSFVATASLVAARQAFLHLYNRIAKPIVRGLLADLGREEEYRQFFGDLTANESAGGKEESNEPTPTETSTPS